VAKTSGRSVNDGPTVPSQFGAPNPDNCAVLGFARKTGKPLRQHVRNYRVIARIDYAPRPTQHRLSH